MKKMIIILLFVCQPLYGGSILIWGNCEDGRCGDPNEPPDGLPFPDGNDFIDIAMSGLNGFGLNDAGTIIAWGYYNRYEIMDVPEGNYVAVDAGSNHAIALTDEGYLEAWGNEQHGRCDVSTEGGWLKVAAKSCTTAALKNDGTIGIWGCYPYEVNESNLPIHYLPADDYSDVKAGSSFVLMLKEDGSLIAYGDNQYGRCDVPDGTFKSIGCGYYHGIAVRTDGTLEAWGKNDWGQCDVPEGNNFVAVDGGYYHSVAIKEDGSLVAWGRNLDGQCDVPDVCSVSKISVCSETNLALTSESELVLTINVEPNDINTVSPGIGDFYCYMGEQVPVNAQRCPLCPYVWTFDYWSGDIGEPNEPTQFVQMFSDKTITAHYKQLERVCGDECHPILQGDLNEDCYINFDDFAIYAASWLACTHPDCD